MSPDKNTSDVGQYHLNPEDQVEERKASEENGGEIGEGFGFFSAKPKINIDIKQIEKEGYESRLRSAIREELNAFWVAEQPMIGLFDDDRLIAVACLTAPDAAFGSGRYWHWRLRMLLTAGLFGTKQMLEKEEKVRALVPADNFHMLSFIAVHPDYQHHGLGHILLGAIDSVVEEDAKSEGIAVFVTVPSHRHFFNDDNYQIVSQLHLSHIDGDIMFRKKQN